MYTTSATAAMDPFSNDDLTVSSGVTVTVWGVTSFNVYKAGCVPPPGDRAPSRAFTHLLEPLLLRSFWLQMELSAAALAAALAAGLAAAPFAAATAVATAIASCLSSRATGAATASDGDGWRRPTVRGRRWGLLRGTR